MNDLHWDSWLGQGQVRSTVVVHSLLVVGVGLNVKMALHPSHLVFKVADLILFGVYLKS